jgi:hypothetical protein
MLTADHTSTNGFASAHTESPKQQAPAGMLLSSKTSRDGEISTQVDRAGYIFEGAV